MEATWIRARTPEQKTERRHEIMEAAAALFRARDYADVSLNAIAREAGFTKSNVYRYFSTRDEIFLHLYLDSATQWVGDLCAALGDLPPGSDAVAISRAWVGATVRAQRFLELMPLLAASLERNSAEETLIHARRIIHSLTARIVAELRCLIPDLPTADGFALLVYFQSLVAGLWSHAHPNETLDRVLDRPEFDGMRVDFEPMLESAMCLFMEDVIRRAASPHGQGK